MDWATLANFSAAAATIATAGVALWIAKKEIRAAAEQLQQQLAADKESRLEEVLRVLLADYAATSFDIASTASRLSTILDGDLWKARTGGTGDLAREVSERLAHLELARTQIVAHRVHEFEQVELRPSEAETMGVWSKLLMTGEVNPDRRRQLATWLVNVASAANARQLSAMMALSESVGPVDTQ